MAMGFKKPDLQAAVSAIRSSLIEIHSGYNDGWTSASCKKELYQLKCWLDDEYVKLPKFFEEPQWEQERLITILKKD
jgi:hypothetical protein